MIYGDYEHEILYLDDIVVLPQIRKTKNSKIEEIKESIENKGRLINQLDVVKLNELEFLKHVRFLTDLWKKEIKIDSFKKIDGHFYVLIAGHTRLQALKLISKNKKDRVKVKLHDAKNSEEILSIQLDENLHSEPKIEERAIAIIETYHIGLLNNKWKNKEDFAKKMNKSLSRRVISDALAFANLDNKVQEYVFTHNIPFAIGVELGRIYDIVEAYEKDICKDNYEENVNLHYAVLLLKLQKINSVKKGLSFVSSHAKELTDHFNKEKAEQEMIEWFLDGVNRQDDIRTKELLNEHKTLSRDLKSHPFEYYINLLSLDQTLTGVNHKDDINVIENLYSNHMKKELGIK